MGVLTKVGRVTVVEVYWRIWKRFSLLRLWLCVHCARLWIGGGDHDGRQRNKMRFVMDVCDDVYIFQCAIVKKYFDKSGYFS